MAQPIEVTEIRTGQTLTALRNRKSNDSSWVGSVLEVLAVDLPFVVVRETASRYGAGMGKRPFCIDTREYELATISSDYVNAMEAATA